MVTLNDITFNPSRDGYPGVAVAFVIEGEVVATKSFEPSFANNFILNSPVFSQNEDNMSVDIVAGANSINVTLSELFTAVVLSNPTIVRLTLENGKHVTPGWNYENDKFFITTSINGITKTYYGDNLND